jgi:hypothetical protein
MAHRIEEHDKQQGLTMAWHGLTEIKEDLSLDNNWLNAWDIQAQPLVLQQFAGGDGISDPESRIIETKFQILTATDDPSIVIGVPFADSYRPITNAEFLQLMKNATKDTGAKLISVGSVRNRGRVFASFEVEKLGEYKAGGRVFKPYINFGNGHDKSSALWANTSNIATVCDNTFSMNLNKVEEAAVEAVRQRHTKHVMLKLPELGAILNNAVKAQQDFAVAFEDLATRHVTGAVAERLLVGFIVEGDKLSVRSKNIVARLMDLFRTGRGNHGESLADLFSAVTDYYTHENAGKNAARQFASSEFGTGAERKQSFFQILTNPIRLGKTEERGGKILRNDD